MVVDNLKNAITNICIYEDATERPPSARITKPGVGPIRLMREVQEEELLVYGKKCAAYNLFGAEIDDLIDCIKPEELNKSVIIRGDTPEIYQDILPNNLPITCTQRHLLQIMSTKDNNNNHAHGISPELLKRIPELLESPVLVAENPNHKERLLIMVEAIDDETDRFPLMVPIKPNGFGYLEMLTMMTNHITTVFGQEHKLDYFGSALKEDNIIYISSKGKDVIKGLTGLDLVKAYPNVALDTKTRKPNLVFDKRQTTIQSIIDEILADKNADTTWTLIEPPYNHNEADFYSSLNH